jgi:hypothetical protein
VFNLGYYGLVEEYAIGNDPFTVTMVTQPRQDLEHLEDDKKKTLFDLINTCIRNAKGRKTYA